MIKTLKVRVRDQHAKLLGQQARAVNFVWNYLNDLSYRNIREHGRFLRAFDMHPYTQGAGKELGLHAQTLQMIAAEYVARRKQFKKSRLAWRKSSGSGRSTNKRVDLRGVHLKILASLDGTFHDRDINVAKNILALGYERLAGGIPSLPA